MWVDLLPSITGLAVYRPLTYNCRLQGLRMAQRETGGSVDRGSRGDRLGNKCGEMTGVGFEPACVRDRYSEEDVAICYWMCGEGYKAD